ncbi:MAG: phage holin family protein [Clostridiales bacterium]|jgi:toxin secretion/phage lysis holin|nr:phage holin family protein [Clostridiales bacterium]
MLENIYIRGIIGGAISLAAYLFGALDALLLALMAMMGIDFVTGIIKAAVLKEVTSQKMFLGGARKIGIFFIVAVSNLVDNILELGGVLRTVTIAYFMANEAISLLENWSLMGLPIPKKLKDVLIQLRDRGKS